MTNVTHKLARQVVDRGKDPAGDHIAFDPAEPEFNLIEPRGIGGSEVQVHLGMIGQELRDPLGLMGREVVGDEVDLTTLGLQRNNLAHEGHKLLSGMSGSGLTQNLAAGGVERGIERERTVPIVLEAVALGPPRAKRQHRVEAIEGLDRGLLIDTEHRSMLRRHPAERGGYFEVWEHGAFRVSSLAGISVPPWHHALPLFPA